MNVALRPVVVCWRYWPQLAACYLTGTLVRTALIELAAVVAQHGYLWPTLIMPLVAAVHVGTYVAMLLVLRHEIPGLGSARLRALRNVDVFNTVIVPFFVIYLGWGLFIYDWAAYEKKRLALGIAARRMAMAGGDQSPPDVDPNALPEGYRTLVLLIGAALIVRFVLGRYANRLPTLFTVVKIYLDIFWIYLVFALPSSPGFTFLVNPSGWLAHRRFVVWFKGLQESVLAHLGLGHPIVTAVVSAVQDAVAAAAVPLMWLAVAGIVYQATAATAAEVPSPADRKSHPAATPTLRARLAEFGLAKTGRFRPIVESIRVIRYGGLVGLPAYVGAYLLLAMADRTGSFYGQPQVDGYLVRGIAWLLHPRAENFWDAVSGTLRLASDLVVEPLRMTLVAVMFGFCVAGRRRSEQNLEHELAE